MESLLVVDEYRRLRLIVSHPSRKNKNAARMRHPENCRALQEDFQTIMKMTQIVFRTVALSLLLTGAFAQAQVTGTVTNKTTGKPAAGDAVVLVDVQAGMGEVAKATTDSGGHYKLSKPGSSNYLVRVTHQGATYFIGAPEGNAPGDISVYDVAAKVDGVLIDRKEH